MTAVQTLRKLHSLGAGVCAVNGMLRLTAPVGTIPMALLEQARAQRTEILLLLDSGEAHIRALCAHLGGPVRTPRGTGTLWQVFRNRVGVEHGDRIRFFAPSLVELAGPSSRSEPWAPREVVGDE